VAVDRRFEPPNVIVITLAGVVTSRDQAELLEWARAVIRQVGPIAVLIHLEAFSGWKLDDAWDHKASWLNDDEGVSKLAFVGRPDWKPIVFNLVAQPIRQFPIGYFESEMTARAWLQQSTLPAATSPHRVADRARN
jgi:SpoIIAA-like